jgi:hypothetical protein
MLSLASRCSWLAAQSSGSRDSFFTTFLSSTETRFFSSIFLILTTFTSRVSGMCAPMFLSQVAMLLKLDFLGNTGRRISTWPFFSFLSVEGRLLGFLIWLALLIGTYAFNSFQRSQKRAHVQRRHAFLIKIVLVLPREWTHTQHMSPSSETLVCLIVTIRL